jgi:hypothetical protein
MNGVGTVVEVSMNWNPSYSYSSLPEGYDPETIPSHWKTMLQQVDPPERGIPEFKDVSFDRIRVTNGRRAIAASGMPESIVKHFVFNDVRIESESAGRIAHARGWTFNDVVIQTPDNSRLDVSESTEMQL